MPNLIYEPYTHAYLLYLDQLLICHRSLLMCHCSSTHEIATFLEWLTYFEHVALCFYKHVYLRHPLLYAHPTKCHSNIDIRLRPITELGKSTLVHNYFCLEDIMFQFVYSIWHGPPLSHLHGKELRK